MDNILHAQYGCGFSNPQGWLNFDASPTLRIQKTPIIGSILKSRLNVLFPENIKYGDILKGLPLDENSMQGMYCSHILEHLSFYDCKLAVKNSYKYLKPGGIFRCVVPDIEYMARKYITELDQNLEDAGNIFIRETLMGVEKRNRGLKSILTSSFGNSHHLWMWDKKTLSSVLYECGFNQVRVCKFNDSSDELFKLVEDSSRFDNAVSLEAIK